MAALRKPGSAGRRCRDLLLWAGLAAPALGADLLGLNENRPLWQQCVGAVVLAAAVTVARRTPLGAFALAAVLGLATAPALFSLSYAPALAVLALLLGLRADRMRPAALCFAAVGCAGTVRIALLGADPAPEWLVLMCTLLFCCVFPWLVGGHRRQGRELAEAGWLRAARLEDEQRYAEERARTRERARIAQDMHDSLGHELSLIALRAGALQVAADLPAHHRAAAADLRVAAADATDRLHRVIGVLREDDDEPAPLSPAGESVEQLVARAADSGLPVRWEHTDRAGAGRRPAPEPGGVTDRLLHRVVREALTNAARHAPGATVVVAVTGEAAEVTERARAAGGVPGTTVTVSNGPATQRSSRPAGGGSGLLGLRAAVTAVGGSFTAGPCDSAPYEGGFRVRAWMPDRAPGRVPGRVPDRVPDHRPGQRVGGVHPAGHPVNHPVNHPASPTADRAPAPTADRAPAPTADRLSVSEPAVRARRKAAHALWVAACAGVVLVGGAFGWYAYTETHSVLRPDTYTQLRLGTAASDIEPLLPDRSVADPPADRAPAPPPGAACHYYRSSGELLVSVDHFRLCYDDTDRLIAKDVVPGAGRQERKGTAG
ncbi:sensor histidine kinase [Streptomyces sp. NPDC088789]|uniref:sensor histidine kinase n=1 Tax=Streptomyces sp. NPDC088789 TaxID=3365899 RepID=UPI0037F92580